MGVDIIIILDIVLVVGRGYEQRIEVDHLHSQLLQVIQLLHDTRQISAVEFCHAEVLRVLPPVRHLAAIGLDIIILVVLYVIRRISIVEAIHQKLVHHRSFRPVRRRKARHNGEIILRARLPRDTSAVIAALLKSRLCFKIILHCRLLQRQPYPVIIELLRRLILFHRKSLLVHAEPDHIQVILACPEADRHCIARFRLRRLPIVDRPIGEKSTLIQHRTHFHHIF